MKSALALLGVLVLATPAMAAGSTSNSTGTGKASAVAIVQGGSSSGSSAPTEETIHNTPDMAISSYAGGANPCGVGGSVGVTMAGIGVGGSVATEGHDCTMRAWFILLASASEHMHNPAYMQWAIGIACANADLKAVAPPGICVAAAPAAPAAVATAYAAPASTGPFVVPAPGQIVRPDFENHNGG